MDNIRDCFLFECYSGLSYIDMKNLVKSDFRKTEDGQYYIKKRRQKTNQELSFEFEDFGNESIETDIYDLK